MNTQSTVADFLPNMLKAASEEQVTDILARVAGFDWDPFFVDLDKRDYAVLKSILLPEECRELASAYTQDAPFRKRIVMARHGLGSGEYKYWSYPLPGVIQELRTSIYPYLAGVANRWNESMAINARF